MVCEKNLFCFIYMMCLYNDYYSVYLLALFRMIPGCVAQSVMCRLQNMILTVNPGVVS